MVLQGTWIGYRGLLGSLGATIIEVLGDDGCLEIDFADVGDGGKPCKDIREFRGEGLGIAIPSFALGKSRCKFPELLGEPEECPGNPASRIGCVVSITYELLKFFEVHDGRHRSSQSTFRRSPRSHRPEECSQADHQGTAETHQHQCDIGMPAGPAAPLLLDELGRTDGCRALGFHTTSLPSCCDLPSPRLVVGGALFNRRYATSRVECSRGCANRMIFAANTRSTSTKHRYSGPDATETCRKLESRSISGLRVCLKQASRPIADADPDDRIATNPVRKRPREDSNLQPLPSEGSALSN